MSVSTVSQTLIYCTQTFHSRFKRFMVGCDKKIGIQYLLFCLLIFETSLIDIILQYMFLHKFYLSFFAVRLVSIKQAI